MAEIIGSYPSVYWAPLVKQQIAYLRRLQSDDQEWRRLGWKWHSEWDGEYEICTPPNEVAAVTQQLERLVEAHSSGLFPDKRIEWKRPLSRRGPKSGIKNPYPTWEPLSERIPPEWLAQDFRLLRAWFKAVLEASEGGPRTKAAAKAWYRGLAQTVVESPSECYTALARAALLEGEELPVALPVGWWNGYKWLGKTVESETVAPTVESETVAPEEGESRRRNPLNLDASLDAMLSGKAGREGKPAYLAYAVLAALLDVTPGKIRNTIGNSRYQRRPRGR